MSDEALSPTRLALMLGAGLLGLVLLLSLLAPEDIPVELGQLDRLVKEGRVDHLAVHEGQVRAQLHEPVLVELSGQRYRTDRVVLTLPSATVEQHLTAWGPAVSSIVRDDAPSSHWRESLWLALVGLLLLFGLYHLFVQARRHRREGSPRQRLEEAREEFEAGRISSEEYERRASALSVEL
jgi:hypothetical protein